MQSLGIPYQRVLINSIVQQDSKAPINARHESQILSSFIADVLMPLHYLGLEASGILVPQFGSLTVQRRSTARSLVSIFT